MKPDLSKWLCNKCGHEFFERDANGVDVDPDSDERSIACPKCWANNLDNDDENTSLASPYDRMRRAEELGLMIVDL